MAQSTLYSDIKDMPEHPFQPVSFKFKLHIDFAKIKFAKFLKIERYARSQIITLILAVPLQDCLLRLCVYHGVFMYVINVLYSYTFLNRN